MLLVQLQIASVYAQSGNQIYYDSLLKNYNFFVLRESLSTAKTLSTPRKLYYQCLCKNYFNNPSASAKNINYLLSHYQTDFKQFEIARLIKTNVNNYLRLFLYKKAYSENKMLLGKYKKHLTELEIEDVKTNNQLLAGLLKIQPQTVVIYRDTRISTTKDAAGLINIPVSVNDSSDSYVFDTGANFSVITESNAKRHHLQLMDFYFDVKAITGKMVKARIGVLNKLKIGDIEFGNVVFLVFPDGSLSFANGRYVINGIIGFPVIEQLGEIRMNKTGYIEVPQVPIHQAYANLGFDELTPVINVETQHFHLPYTFDTGAKLTVLNKSYYTLFKNEIDRLGKPVEIALGGAAGVAKLKGLKLPLWHSSINGLQFNLPDIDVKIVSTTDRDSCYYGNIGQDVIQQFSEMVMNFKSMYISFRK